MASTYMNGRSQGFDLMQVVGTTRGYVTEVDPLIKKHLDDLNTILGRQIFPQDWLRQTGEAGASGGSIKAKAASSRAGSRSGAGSTTQAVHSALERLLTLPLTAKRVPANEWAKDSLAYHFMHVAPGPTKLTLSNLLDATPELATLKYAFQDDIHSNLYTLDFTARTILDGYPAIRDYLVAYAFHVRSLEDDGAIKNFILSNPSGVRNIADYAIVGAARSYIDHEKLTVADYDDDSSAIVASVKAADFGLDAASFTPGIKALVADHVFNSRESELIDFAVGNGLGTLPPGVKPMLIKYIQASPVLITKQNVMFFAPGWIQQIARSMQIADETPAAAEQSDTDFDVKFLDDDRSQLKISKSAVKCASQLYYSMILGDELEVFNVINYFTHKYLIRGSLTIEDSHLRDDLQSYVFSNRFTDRKTNKVVDRTRPAERAMFYRQVFNYGSGPVTEDVIVNHEFSRLWKVLMLESANYLERAQISPNAEAYVSRRNVMQAVEDLQYNLSTHCTGMSNVITPLIYAELDFVIRRIFMHPEILRQVVPAGGTWWRVVETLYMGMKNERPKTTVIYSKAKSGHDIISRIADYDAAVFARNQPFSAFISEVQGFITTQSILQDALKHDLRRSASGDASDEEEEDPLHHRDAAADAPGESVGNPAPGQEWNF